MKKKPYLYWDAGSGKEYGRRCSGEKGLASNLLIQIC